MLARRFGTLFGLMSAFRARPQEQQITDVTWIAEAGNEAEAHERIAQLLDELEEAVHRGLGLGTE